MNEIDAQISGCRLSLDEYIEDFGRRFWSSGNAGSWKFERRQTFRQPESASWNAFHDGDWDRALELIEARRSDLRDYYERVSGYGFKVHRVRVVEEPLSPYLMWELNSLLLRSEYGDSIRIVESGILASFEGSGRLPEVFVIEPDIVYQVLYDVDGIAVGAIRSDDRNVVRQWVGFIKRLHGEGEDLGEFFPRRVAGLRPSGAA